MISTQLTVQWQTERGEFYSQVLDLINFNESPVPSSSISGCGPSQYRDDLTDEQFYHCCYVFRRGHSKNLFTQMSTIAYLCLYFGNLHYSETRSYRTGDVPRNCSKINSHCDQHQPRHDHPPWVLICHPAARAKSEWCDCIQDSALT